MPEPAVVAAPPLLATVEPMQQQRVLLAEDDRATRESLGRALELEGHKVRAVADGSGVFDGVASEPADVLCSTR
jgi:CheY-like chemotaxis protein